MVLEFPEEVRPVKILENQEVGKESDTQDADTRSVLPVDRMEEVGRGNIGTQNQAFGLGRVKMATRCCCVGVK